MIDTAAIAGRFETVRAAVARTAIDMGRKPQDVTLIAVSKTYPAEAVIPVLEAGQGVFGENYVQEAASSDRAAAIQQGKGGCGAV
jgi:PLP dependent protein